MLNHLYIHYAIQKFVDIERKKESAHKKLEYEREKVQGYEEEETNFIMAGIDRDEKIMIQDRYGENRDTAKEEAEGKLSDNRYLNDEL